MGKLDDALDRALDFYDSLDAIEYLSFLTKEEIERIIEKIRGENETEFKIIAHFFEKILGEQYLKENGLEGDVAAGFSRDLFIAKYREGQKTRVREEIQKGINFPGDE